jgi:AraC-like DNA-binding protein
MGVIATYLPNNGHLQRLRAALRDRHELVICEAWPDLIRACEQRPVRVAVFDFFAGSRGGASFEHVRYLKQRLPRTTLIAYVAFTADRLHDIFDAGRQGVDALVVADVDDAPRALLAIVEQAESRSLAVFLRRSLEGVDVSVADALLLSVSRAHERLSPEGLARLLVLPRRTVSQRLSTSGFPPPQRLLTWGRLIVAAHLLEDAHRSADRVAVSLDFPSGSAFRNTCQRYLHARPREIRQRGGASFAIRNFFREVESAQRARSATRDNRRPSRVLSLAV